MPKQAHIPVLARGALAEAHIPVLHAAPLPGFEIPKGFRLADAPPLVGQLEFKNPTASKLVGKFILFNWPAAGWCLGEIVRANSDGRRTVEKGMPANFFVYYEIDEDESKHALALDEYGRGEMTNAWTLLEAEAAE